MRPFLQRLAYNERRRRARRRARLNALILAHPAPGYPFGRCGYCGEKTPNLALTCAGHADLPANDPYINPHVVLTETEPAEDFPQEAIPDRLTTQGA